MRRAAVASAAALLAIGGLALATPGAFGGFTAKITNSTDTVGTAPFFQCASAMGADSSTALLQWPLADPAGSTTAADISGTGHTGTYVGTTTTDSSAPMACPRDSGPSWSLDGTQWAFWDAPQVNPQTFTVEIWFRTTVAAGKLIGFGVSKTGASSQYDRHLYIASTGAVVFGVYSSGAHALVSPGTNYADGAWHSAVGTLSSAGTVLYIDGKQVAADPASTVAENYTGYWRVGYDTVGGSWPSAPPTGWFKGRLRYAAVYSTALTATQVKAHDAAGR
jgi:hypothetical protein